MSKLPKSTKEAPRNAAGEERIRRKKCRSKTKTPSSKTQKKRIEICGNLSKREKEMQENDLFEEV